MALEIHCCSSIAGHLDLDSPGFKLVSDRHWACGSGPQGLRLQKGRCLSKFPKLHLCSPSMPRARSPKAKVNAWPEISSTSIFARNGNKCHILREGNHSETCLRFLDSMPFWWRSSISSDFEHTPSRRSAFSPASLPQHHLDSAENFGMGCAQLLGASVRSTYLKKPREKLEIWHAKNARPFGKGEEKVQRSNKC